MWKTQKTTPKLLEVIEQFSNEAGYKINAQKSVAFLYTNNETEEREIRESIPFTIAPKITRYLGTNLTIEVKDLYSRNYRTLLKDIEEDTKGWKNIPCSWIGRTNIVKMSMLPRAIYTFTPFRSKYQWHFSNSWNKQPLNLCGMRKGPKSPRNCWKGRTKLGHHVARFQAILQSCDHKDSMVLQQKQTHRPMEQNREPRNGPSVLGQLIFDKAGKKHPVEKRQSLQ